MLRKTSGLILTTVLLVSLFVRPVLANEYPVKPIEIVVPYTAGGSTDILARLIGETASKYLGQRLVVVNKPGGGGSTAVADVINSRPDGYKLVTLTNMYFATTVKTQKIPFDPSSVVPLANFIEYRLGLIVKGDSPWKTLGDLLSYAKKNPGTVRWAHLGRGITMHMQGLLMFRKAGVETIDVPYKGNPESIAALLGGHIDAAVMPYGTVREQVRAGKVRYLIFFSDHRYKEEPDVPSAVDLGFPDTAKLGTYVGLYAHKNTPEEIKKILIDAFKKTYDDPGFKKGIQDFGEEPMFGGPEFIKESIKKGEEVGIPVIKELGLYVGK